MSILESPAGKHESAKGPGIRFLETGSRVHGKRQGIVLHDGPRGLDCGEISGKAREWIEWTTAE